MTLFPLTDCCKRLSVDPKTLRQWVKHAGLPLHAHPTDARVKCLTLPQVQQLASSHGRTLQPHPVLPLSSGASTSACGEPTPLTSPASASEGDLHQKLAALEAQVALLHHQLAHLTSVLLGQQTSVDHPRASLAALVLPTGLLRPCSPELAQKEGVAQAEAGPRPHPAESRRRPLLPLIEYGAQGSYVVICPQEGELHLRPDSPEWFAWLASVSSFRFVGKCGRFTACRVYDKGPTRSWQAHRVIHQRLYKPHLGVTEHLTIDRLEQAAATLQSYVDSR
jgi:uncharacterized coiled-coil protein SlyX